MTSTASRILEWRNKEGERRALIVVVDDGKHLEICSLNEDDEWKTEEVIEEFSEILDFGIPESLLG